MFGYATDLRSITQGRGVFTMQFSHYEEAPKFILEKIVKKQRWESPTKQDRSEFKWRKRNLNGRNRT